MNTVRVALEVPIPKLFDYRVGNDLDPQIGQRVLVPFGSQRRVGVVVPTDDVPTVGEAKLRAILAVLSDTPPLPPDWFALAEFCSDYYQRPLGEVILGALPPRLKRPEPLSRTPSAWTITDAGRAFLAEGGSRRKSTRLDLLQALVGEALPSTALLDFGSQARKALHALCAAGLVAPITDAAESDHRFIDERTLNDAQRAAVDAIIAARSRFNPFLLFGVTGSGKTEVYLHAIHRMLTAGNQALVLVPEINLTPQLAAELQERFPASRLAVMHSALAANDRAHAWIDAQTGRADIVLATRIGVFAPFARLGLIVVDEEHDSSFKQQDGVRYSARDLAVVRAQQLGIPVVLGSATPALESFANARAGRYRLLELPERVRRGSLLPTIQIVDTRTTPEEHGITAVLADAVRACIGRGEQSLIFLNRRGYAPVLACGACGWIGDCTRCAAHLVVHYEAVNHQSPRESVREAPRTTLRCHHCGLQVAPPRACPTCGNVDLLPFGRGTQRLEDSINAQFPGARVLRIDSDSTRRKGVWSAMRAAIDAGEVDILIGTQILAKGHDFPRLTLVGILNADAALLAADYRAPERLFAQLQQVSGRAGRADLPGTVVLQTRFPEAALYRALARNDYTGFATQLLAERQAAGFPPALAEAVLRTESKDHDAALDFLRIAVAQAPSNRDGITLFDPVPMMLARLSGWYRAHVLVQSPSRRALQTFLGAWLANLHNLRAPRNVRWHVDVDPLEF